ncbi:MAG: GNAT family N-acetyltransferase [Solirubrobacterales bacterium]
MDIIKLGYDDVKAAMELVHRVFMEFEAPEYSEDGIKEFEKFIEYNSVIKMMDNGELSILGAKDHGLLKGIIANRGNHISLLFVDKEFHRKGIARKLFNVLVEELKREGVKDITVNSSPYAVDIYIKLGFNATDMEQVVNGIRFTPMIYIMN